MMPEMDGIETLKVMKTMEDYPNKDTPVIILTANAIVGAREQYLAEGFQAFLSKPIDFHELEKLIEELLDKTLIHHVKKPLLQDADISISTSELPLIDGLDWEYAATHFKNEEMLLKTVKLFVDSIEYEAKNLEALYLEHEQAEGRKKYCTKVHSMKSSAAIIGIIPFAGMAKALEDAARNNECDVIKHLTPVFLKKWRAYKEHLKEFSNTANGMKSAAEYSEQVSEIFYKIKEAAEEMDIDALDGALVKLEEYKFEGAQAERFDQIKEAIINFDVTFLQSII